MVKEASSDRPSLHGEKVSYPTSLDDIKHHLVYHHGFRATDGHLDTEDEDELNQLHQQAHASDLVRSLIEHYH